MEGAIIKYFRPFHPHPPFLPECMQYWALVGHCRREEEAGIAQFLRQAREGKSSRFFPL